MKILKLLYIIILSCGCFLFQTKIVLAQSDSIVPGVILVKFERNALNQLNEELDTADILLTRLHNVLQQYDFKHAQKLFRHATPADTIATSLKGKQVKLKDISGWYVVKVADTSNTAELAKELSRTPCVQNAVPGHFLKQLDTYPNDPRFQEGEQWGLRNTSYPGNDIHATRAWDFNRGRNDVIIAVVDGGVDYNHSDLDPGNRSRVTQGWDVADDDNDAMDNIPNGEGFAGHGTGVAGVLGAITDNNNSVAGVMWNCQIMPVKVAWTDGPWWDPFGLTTGESSDWTVAEGIDFARTHGAKVINMSLGGSGLNFWQGLIGSNPLAEATWNAYQQGIFLAGAMGNDDNETVKYPAGYPWVTAVGATNQFDERVSGGLWGSNVGEHIDLSAPGISQVTVARNGGEQSFNGTSCATPFVAGAAGLIFSQSLDRNLNLTNDDVKHLLEATADDINSETNPGWDQFVGYGRINVATALSRISLPFQVAHATVTSSNASLVWDSHNQVFFNNTGLASGFYAGTKTYKVTSHVTFATPYQEVPYVWIRESDTHSWNASNPNLELPWAKVTNVTTQGFDVEGYVHYVGQRPGEGCVCKYWPGNSDNIQLNFDYTVIGRHTIPTPTSLTSVLQSTPTIRLSWQDNSSNEATFQVERSADGVNYSVIGEVVTNGNGSGTRTFDDANIQQDMMYSYRVHGHAQEFNSALSNIASVSTALSAVTLSSPENGTTNVHVQPTLSWASAPGAQSYEVQVDTDGSLVSPFVYTNTNVVGTSVLTSGLGYNTTYFWRVRAKNAFGTGAWSSVRSFTTSIAPPATPANFHVTYTTLGCGGIEPEFMATIGEEQNSIGGGGCTYNTLLTWNSCPGTGSSIEIYRGISPSDLRHYATLEYSATSFIDCVCFGSLTVYYYYIVAVNAGGQSNPTATLCNGASKIGINAEETSGNLSMFSLSQNTPNPFNPTTVINYNLPDESYVTLKVYNTLGNEVAVLVDDVQSTGNKYVTFNAQGLPSGIYYYRLSAIGLASGSSRPYTEIKKMLLLK